MAELFSLLDRSVPREALGHIKKGLLFPEECKARIEKHLFFAGAGTWQQLWTGGGAMGFGAGRDKKSNVLDQVAAEKVVLIELLMRFTWPPLVLQYPGPEESVDLFNKTGLLGTAPQLPDAIERLCFCRRRPSDRRARQPGDYRSLSGFPCLANVTGSPHGG
jgi:hypothetical protein